MVVVDYWCDSVLVVVVDYWCAAVVNCQQSWLRTSSSGQSVPRCRVAEEERRFGGRKRRSWMKVRLRRSRYVHLRGDASSYVAYTSIRRSMSCDIRFTSTEDISWVMEGGRCAVGRWESKWTFHSYVYCLQSLSRGTASFIVGVYVRMEHLQLVRGGRGLTLMEGQTQVRTEQGFYTFRLADIWSAEYTRTWGGVV